MEKNNPSLAFSRTLAWFKPIPWISLITPHTLDDKPIPSDEECLALCAQYDIMEHIQRHCMAVADLATALAKRAVEIHGTGEEGVFGNTWGGCLPGLVPVTRAAGLLHDVAKSYCVRHGGGHAQIGASWVLAATGNHYIAQAVMHHVEWPWHLPENVCLPAHFVSYADRRVRHDEYVSLEDRYTDLQDRYGKTPERQASIRASQQQAIKLERALSAHLELPLYACTLSGGRLVPRT